MSRASYILKRSLITVALIYIVATVLFFAYRLMPGSYLTFIAQSGASAETLQNLKPLHVQYFRYVSNMLHGNFGRSLRYNQPVLELTLPKIFNSFILIGPGIVTAYLIGSVLGAVMGNNRGSKLEEYNIVLITAIGMTPSFVTGILLILVFSSWLGIFPSSGVLSISARNQLAQAGFIEKYTSMSFLKHYVLPFSTIVIRYVYFPSLIMRTSVIEVSNQDFMYYHRMKGLAKSTRVRRLMKHASLPVLTMFPISMTRAIGGLVIIETVFNWPGIGALLVSSVLRRDYPVIQFLFLLTATWVIIGNYVIDLLYGVIDPRVSVEDGGS
jgi:peptide/nickel transport system permease protein